MRWKRQNNNSSIGEMLRNNYGVWLRVENTWTKVIATVYERPVCYSLGRVENT